MQVDQPVF